MNKGRIISWSDELLYIFCGFCSMFICSCKKLRIMRGSEARWSECRRPSREFVGRVWIRCIGHLVKLTRDLSIIRWMRMALHQSTSTDMGLKASDGYLHGEGGGQPIHACLGASCSTARLPYTNTPTHAHVYRWRRGTHHAAPCHQMGGAVLVCRSHTFSQVVEGMN